MLASLVLAKRLDEKIPSVHIIPSIKEAEEITYDKNQLIYLRTKLSEPNGKALVWNGASWCLLLLMPETKQAHVRTEKLRQIGASIQKWANEEKFSELQVRISTGDSAAYLAVTEGLLLASYQFNKYKSEKKENSLKTLHLLTEDLSKKDLKELQNVVEGTLAARTLINEPYVFLSAEQLSKEIGKLGKQFGFSTEVLNKSKIKSLKMGGILAVNAGSAQPPTFNILEYKPAKPKNKKPIVLVGKGVVYDTGGLSIKPTPGSMDYMKSDMSGAAAVIGTFVAAAANKLNIHLIGLIPATDNCVDSLSIAPGDVITMYDKQTVEILNTDAEGRLILADALAYAKKYKPELVIDLATLTGSAIRAIGTEGAVMMGTAEEETKRTLSQAGLESYERLVEFPMWEEYEKQLKSDIADFSNLGGPYAGATTAGIFLKKFIDYPWIHIDIAGPAYLHAADSYRGKNGTGFGVRLLYAFLKSLHA
ncbi:leucyl aminopeptidase [Cytophagales bacterium LB-30]|uniref:Leucyl aminopeptidase n=1 Tax=Shiella aurantiaca TaxID=3058365 RepID=A0ABT8F3B2_9BACT|nr:leucyl aminopeptidase [Shiella aurantiaca]MDN4164952.1 leucyl aminopeptidase [Shiella aurantiaca]